MRVSRCLELQLKSICAGCFNPPRRQRLARVTDCSPGSDDGLFRHACNAITSMGRKTAGFVPIAERPFRTDSGGCQTLVIMVRRGFAFKTNEKFSIRGCGIQGCTKSLRARIVIMRPAHRPGTVMNSFTPCAIDQPRNTVLPTRPVASANPAISLSGPSLDRKSVV